MTEMTHQVDQVLAVWQCTLFECQVKNALYLSVTYLARKWSSEPREGLAICTAKVVPSFLSQAMM